MANHASAEKAARQGERRRLRNRSTRSAIRSQLRKASETLASGTAENPEAILRQAVSTIDRAAKKGVVHPNNAARHKSRLAKKFNAAALKAAAPAPEPEPVAVAKPKRAPRRTTTAARKTTKTTTA